MAAQQMTNLAEGTLAAAYTVGDTTLTLDSGQGALFPATGDFIVGLGSPTPDFFLKCTARSSDTLTVSSAAQEGTTRSNKAIGVAVSHLITAGVFDAIRSDISKVGVYASLPSTGMKSGDRYKCTDIPSEFVYDGSVWQEFCLGYYVSPHPPFTWRNQGSASVVATAGTEYLLAPASAGNNVRGREVAVPATPYSITVVLKRHGADINYGTNGLYVTDGTKLTITGINFNGTAGGITYMIQDYSNASTFGTGRVQIGAYNLASSFVVRFTDNGTSHVFEWSVDGVNFQTGYTRSRGAYLSTPTAVGYFAESNNSSWANATKLISWKQT